MADTDVRRDKEKQVSSLIQKVFNRPRMWCILLNFAKSGMLYMYTLNKKWQTALDIVEDEEL